MKFMKHHSSKPKPYLPILIIPGFMSSGLQVLQSDIKEAWVGERLWLNLKALGFEAAHFPRQGDLHHDDTDNNDDIQEEEEEDDDDDNDDSDPLVHSTADHSSATTTATTTTTTTTPSVVRAAATRAKGVRLRNAWLHHMALQEDMVSERDGIQVRAIPGLAGVDYLTPGALTSTVSYVFGPLIRALQSVGYTETLNLDAAPYDWRLPPSALETRDGYYTRTMDQIERLYKNNKNTPVVLVCHSMGCRIGHYLLNFAQQARGQDWIDRYIHTYCPIGGPHLGAPKSIRSVISGDKMGLDTFLSDAEALVMGRCMGSAPLLMPTELPPDAPASAMIRMEGAVEISILGSIETDHFLNRREDGHRPGKLKLMVVFDGTDLSTPYCNMNEYEQVQFNETFTFRTSAAGPKEKQGLTIFLCEEGINSARTSTSNRRRRHLKCRECFFRPWTLQVHGEEARWGRPPKDNKLLFWLNIVTFWWLIWPIVRHVMEFAFKIYFGIVYGFFWCLFRGTLISVDKVARLSGGSSALAVAKVKYVRKEVIRGNSPQKANQVDLDLPLISYRDMVRCCGCWSDNRKTNMRLRIKWISPQSVANPKPRCPHIIAQTTLHNPPVYENLQSKRSPAYAACAGYNLIEAEGLTSVFDHMEAKYDNDPLDPRFHSALDPPPVRIVKAIYGVNLPTEVGAVFRRRKAVIRTTKQVRNLFRLDKHASLPDEDNGNDNGSPDGSKNTSKNNQRFMIKHGVLSENKTSKKKSGDGTVPYWSLNWVQNWEKDCQVSIEELEGAEHREILADKRLHHILMDYCCAKDEISEEKV